MNCSDLASRDRLELAVRRLSAIADLLTQVRSDELAPTTVPTLAGLIDEHISIIDETNRAVSEPAAGAQ